MSTEDIIQNMISELGQTQPERLAAELQPGFVAVDERTPRELYAYLAELAEHVKHHGTNGAEATFKPFFPDTPALEATDGRVTPHLGLLLAFLKLYEQPRAAINRFTARHLDFYYREVLGFVPRPAVPDRAHVVVELKKNVAPVRLLPEHVLSAGKDPTGVEQLYQPVRETVINAAKVSELRCIYLDPDGHGTVRAATKANSSDGVGGELAPDRPAWLPFGHDRLPIAPFGFALSSHVLRMREGDRTVNVSLELGGSLPASVPDHTFEAFLTSDKGWIGPIDVASALSGTRLDMSFEVKKALGPVVDHSPVLHIKPFVADGPVVQLLLKQPSTAGYVDLRGVVVRSARISVDVKGISSLALESDAGTLDPKKVFLPFGPQPTLGSRFLIGCEEALSKSLTSLSLNIGWHGKPADFVEHYQGYAPEGMGAGYFRAEGAYQDASHTEPRFDVALFEQGGLNRTVVDIALPTGNAPRSEVASEARQVYALRTAGSLRALQFSAAYLRVMPVLDVLMPPPPQVRSDFITLRLRQDMLLEAYRAATVSALIKAANNPDQTVTLPKPPYVPAIETISLSYSATIHATNLESAEVSDFAASEARFFHVDPFGVRREHAHLRSQHAYVAGQVPLVPERPAQGELLIGLSNLEAGDSVSVLLENVPGSADPEIAWPTVTWHALCDNYWKKLASAELVLDTTRELRTSGLVGVVVPREATTQNTLLPSGLLWLKAQPETRNNAAKLAELVNVAANAIEVEFRDRGNDPAHHAAPLPPKSVARLKTPLAAVKGVAQPSASFGGAPREQTSALEMRAAERLRHKDRCITPWDYERSVLAAFPELYRVKCVPHARDGAWQAPGHVLMVLVPKIAQGMRNRREPKADQETLDRVREHLTARRGMQVQLHVKNPRYQKIRLNFAVKFRRGYEFNAYRTLLEQEIIAFLSPWAIDGMLDEAATMRALGFGGRMYRSVLLDFVEERPYVDYVRDFAMYTFTASLAGAPDVSEARAETPDAILVSDESHDIRDAP